MWGFYLNYGAEWFLKNIYHDGFRSITGDGSPLTWHTAERNQDRLVGSWKTDDGGTSSIQTFFVEGDEIVRIEYYSHASRKTYLTYELSRKDDHTIAVSRKYEGGEPTHFEIVAQKNAQGQVETFRCTNAEEGFETVRLEYNEQGLLVRHHVSGKGPESGIYESTYDDSGRVLSQKIAEN